MSESARIEWEGLQFFDDHFVCKGRRFEHAQVRSMDYARITQNASGEAHHQSVLEVTTEDGSKVIELSAVRQPPSFFGQDDYDAKADAFERIHRHLAPRTYAQRLGSYLRQLNEVGYFTYNAKRFFPDGTVTTEKGRTANVRKHGLSVKPYSITIEVPSAKSGWQRFKDSWWDSPTIQILTLTDNDCFMALMKLAYQVTWFKLDDLRFGMAEQKQPGETSRPTGHAHYASAASPLDDGPSSGTPSSDFRAVDPAQFLNACKAMANRLAAHAEPRIHASKLAYGYGFDFIEVKNPDSVQAYVRALPDAAYLRFAYALLCTLGSVHNPHFFGTPSYQEARTMVVTELWYRMLDALPKLALVSGGETLSKWVVMAAIAEIDASVKDVQEFADRLNGRREQPYLPLFVALANGSHLWNPDDPTALAVDLEPKMRELMKFGAGLMGVPIAPGASM